MDIQDIFQQLSGWWEINRQISPGGVILGEVEFEAVSDDEYAYREHGTLTLDHGDVVEGVTRSYRYIYKEGAIQVLYADGPDDGKLFQVLEFEDKTRAQAQHLCGQDLYQSRYEFYLPDSFSITHTVTGPKKDYVSDTIFKRLNPS